AVAKAAGLSVSSKNYVGMQAKVKLSIDTKAFETYFGSDFPNFFGWCVPESEDTVRLGIGCFENTQEYFYRFLKNRAGKKEILCWESGLIPLYNPRKIIHKENVYLIGDAATQLKATTGGGIIPSLKAAHTLCDCIVNKKDYNKEFRRHSGRELLLHLTIRNLLNKFSDKDYDKLLSLMEQEKVKKILKKYEFILQNLFKTSSLSFGGCVQFMDSKEDDDIPIDFSKIKNFFKRNKEEKKLEEAKEPIKEDEIIIDFSKIKKFFKSDEIEKVKTEHKEEKVSDDELSFDFTKIKKFFKSDEKQYTAEDEVQINWSKIIDFFKKYGIVFIALMPIILSIYVRMQAGFLPIVDDWATNSVINSIKSQISASINQQYPNLPDANKNALVDTELQKFISQNKQRIDQQIRDTSNYFKSFFLDENGKNYMPDIDPYYWYRYAKNIVEHGHPGDTLKDNKPYDDHQLAPVGRFVTPDVFHAYSLAYFYKVMHIFAPNLTLMRSMFYYPIFVSALAVLLVFLIARKISGNLGGFFAGLIMAVNSAFLGRTLFGHADSDAWVVFFPLLITWLFVIIIETKSNLKMIILTIIAGFLTGLYTVAWTGWWYVFDFLLVTIAIEFIYLSLVHLYRAKFNIRSIFFDRAIRNVILIGLIYFLSTTICVTLISGWDMFRGSFLGPLNFPSIKAPVSPSLWPNVLTTVAELNEGSINSIINSIGGQFLFLISLFGLIFAITRSEDFKRFDFVYIASTALFYIILFIRFGSRAPLYQSMQLTSLLIWILLPIFVRIVIAIYKKDITYDFKLSILLSLWIASTIFASIKGIRFTLLMAPAFSVAFGVALGKSYVYLSRWFTKELKIHKAIGSSILIILFLLIYVSPIRGAIASAGSDIPIVNDAWYNALINIKNDSKEDAIIKSWWDFGHHFKAIADRRVTFDGTT
ncbi:hypothetical protein HYW99_02040, partial [Candidatus Woesearchaeota archaeon]|nr:hypothetical protein [Candidatus Woesearchaeota archaeon]